MGGEVSCTDRWVAGARRIDLLSRFAINVISALLSAMGFVQLIINRLQWGECSYHVWLLGFSRSEIRRPNFSVVGESSKVVFSILPHFSFIKA